jgi:hypothetical protein
MLYQACHSRAKLKNGLKRDPTELFQFLAGTKAHDATDTRDKVYSVLALADDTAG